MKQMIVNCEPKFTQMALIEEGKLIEFATERSQSESLVGSFYKGRVVNVLPGMQAAFVDIGHKKNAFLYVDDVLHPHLEKQPKVKPSIEELLKVGQEVVVQVMKESLRGKGPRVTTHYSLPGRWVVFMPISDYVAVSKKIQRESERTRLKILCEQMRFRGEGIIVRTVSQDEPRDAIQGDLNFLRAQWELIQERANEAEAPSLLHRDLSIVQRLIRDVLDPIKDELVINNVREANDAELYLSEMTNGIHIPVKVYHAPESIFKAYGIREQLDRGLARKVSLSSGGTIVWDHTEALTVIDVNTSKYTGAFSLEETVTLTNLQAAEEIARLIRLRDVGGIIVIDFIDMEQEVNRQSVVDILESVMKKDRAKSQIVGWTKLGLLELTRKKVREDTSVILDKECDHCSGTGRINVITIH
ncbi:Rne/Rng family ribonuclease [Paenibacillus antarcticus]|uniref:Ribonuclease n=1 Tax=Paenibacillus antarcticus TaxID=253703 RepID=A0A168QQJ7_9BACL|nr:Rne/Rng family ribonuclease [Paenibacillus antarcticus]OAB48076.1 ribonuclease [Paenibacillus antarcticus]